MKSLTGFSSLWMEGNLKEIATFLEGNFTEKKEIGRKPYVRKVEALQCSINISSKCLNLPQKAGIAIRIREDYKVCHQTDHV